MSKFRNIKVYVPTPEISEAVQKKLFEGGCHWEVSGKVVNRERFPFLYVDNYGVIRWNQCESGFNFNGDGCKEVPYQSILDPHYDIKIAWANGEEVQYKSGGEWHDWVSIEALAMGARGEWRVKPRTKTIKQWERKYHVSGVVFTMIIADKNDDKEVDTWIGEAYQAEYEVPSD